MQCFVPIPISGPTNTGKENHEWDHAANDVKPEKWWITEGMQHEASQPLDHCNGSERYYYYLPEVTSMLGEIFFGETMIAFAPIPPNSLAG